MCHERLAPALPDNGVFNVSHALRLPKHSSAGKQAAREGCHAIVAKLPSSNSRQGSQGRNRVRRKKKKKHMNVGGGKFQGMAPYTFKYTDPHHKSCG